VLLELLLMLMLDGQVALTMSTLLTVMVPLALAVLTPPELALVPLLPAIAPEDVSLLELAVLPVAEPLTPPVLPALGDDPLCGRLELLLELEGVLALALVLVSLLPVALEGDEEAEVPPAGIVLALEEVDGEEELMPAELVSSVPWTFTWWPRCADRLSLLLSFHSSPFLVARKKSLPCWVMQPSTVFSFSFLLAVWVLLEVLV
jgi:hypothetical protein